MYVCSKYRLYNSLYKIFVVFGQCNLAFFFILNLYQNLTKCTIASIKYFVYLSLPAGCQIVRYQTTIGLNITVIPADLVDG